ncbi:MAG: response regulator transcription factor [Propionibacteriales bacterium]|nr:response regulator transcription factor [Propionibacteriales bacterium]
MRDVARDTARILVVEDEVLLARAVRRGLVLQGFDVMLSHDGHNGYRLAREEAIDLVVLDLMLPGLSGLEVLRRLRSESNWTPILVLTAKDGLSDETGALEAGADDYLRKPFSYPVLVARCRALLRRGISEEPVEIRVGDLVLDPRRRTARRRDVPIQLTRREFALLEYLMRNAGRVQSREAILVDVWGADSRRDANVVEVYIGYLRRKVDQSFGTTTVRTVRGAGYMVSEHA